MIHALQSSDAVLDRDCEHRGAPDYLATVQARPGHRVMLFLESTTPVRDGRLLLLDPAALPGPLPHDTLTIYLGKTLPGSGLGLPAGTDLVLHVMPDGAASPLPATADVAWRGFRDAAGLLTEAEAEVFIQAAAVAHWHRSHLFCPRCGAPTTLEGAGWMRRCTQDASEHFPRTDPAVIVAIVGDDDRILLASNFAWDTHRYSTVAGFVEGGESAERAAVREIAEEVGVHLHSMEYLGSQAWPFPRSLMLGFVARTSDTQPVPDGVEVREARWFAREELQAAVLSGEAVISQRLSIARSLIEHWYGGRILEPGEASLAPGEASLAPGEAGSEGTPPSLVGESR